MKARAPPSPALVSPVYSKVGLSPRIALGLYRQTKLSYSVSRYNTYLSIRSQRGNSRSVDAVIFERIFRRKS